MVNSLLGMGIGISLLPVIFVTTVFVYATYVISTNGKLKAYIINNSYEGMVYIDKPSFVRRVRGIQTTTGWTGCTPIYDRNMKRCVIYNDGVSYEAANKLLNKGIETKEMKLLEEQLTEISKQMFSLPDLVWKSKYQVDEEATTKVCPEYVRLVEEHERLATKLNKMKHEIM